MEVREFRLWWFAAGDVDRASRCWRWRSAGRSTRSIAARWTWAGSGWPSSSRCSCWRCRPASSPTARRAGWCSPARCCSAPASGSGWRWSAGSGRHLGVCPTWRWRPAAGSSMALGTPASRAMPPTLVGPELLGSAMTLRSIATQTGQVLGPALGGSAVRRVAVAGLPAGRRRLPGRRRLCDGDAPGVGRRRGRVTGDGASRPTVHERAGGPAVRAAHARSCSARSCSICWRSCSAARSALLPIFARSILHVGATGLGVLRAAPGGRGAARRRRHHPPADRRAGRAAAARGRACLRRQHRRVRAVARRIRCRWLALGVSGFVDLYSMNIRSTTVALATPDRAARPGQRRRDGVHQRLQPARLRSSPGWPRPWSGRSRPSSAAG